MTTENQLSTHLAIFRYFFILIAIYLFPSVGFAEEVITLTHFDLKHQFVGYLALTITVIAYIIAMTEDVHLMKKSKPMIVGSVFNLVCNLYFLRPERTGKNCLGSF